MYSRLVQIGGAAQARRAAVAPLTERSAELPPVRAGERGCALSPPLQVLMLQTEVRRVDAKKERVELLEDISEVICANKHVLNPQYVQIQTEYIP